jgi:hypothetical protein
VCRVKSLVENPTPKLFLVSLDFEVSKAIWGAIHQLLSIILQLRILVLLPVSTMPYVVIVKNYLKLVNSKLRIDSKLYLDWQALI